MKVLLTEDIQKLGWFGDIIEVNNGYARNYLLPQGLATTVSEDSIRALAEEKAKRAEQRIKEKKRLEEAAKAVDGAEAVIAARANEQGHLFGSVSEKQIAANLREQGFTVANEVVLLPEHIKEVGTHQVKLKFADNIIVSVNVVVVPEQDTSE
jgi:large subunit ribosomal protein L9